MMTTIPDDDSDEEWGRIADAVNIFEKQYIAARNSTLPSHSVPTIVPSTAAAVAAASTAPVSHHPHHSSPFASAPTVAPPHHQQHHFHPPSSVVPASSNARPGVGRGPTGSAIQQQQQRLHSPSPFVTTTTTSSSSQSQSQSHSQSLHHGNCGHLSSSAALPPLPPSSSTTRVDPSTSTSVAHVPVPVPVPVPASGLAPVTTDCNGSDGDHCNGNDSAIHHTNDEHPTTNTTGPVTATATATTTTSREPNNNINDPSFYSRVLAQKDDQLGQLQQELTGMQATYRNKVRVLENALNSTNQHHHPDGAAHRIKQLEAEVDKYRSEAHAMRVQDRAHSEDLSFMRQELVQFRDREKKLLAKLALRESVNNVQSNTQNKNQIIVSQTQHPTPSVVQGQDDENLHDGSGGNAHDHHHQDTLPPVVPALTQPGDVVEPTQLMQTQLMSQTQMPTQTQYAGPTVNGGPRVLPTSSQRPSSVVPGGGGGTQAAGPSDMRAPRPPSRRRRRATLHGRNGLVPGAAASRHRATVAGPGGGGGGGNGTQSRKRNYANTNNAGGANSSHQQQQHPLAAAGNGYADYDIPGMGPGTGGAGAYGGGISGGTTKWSSDRYGGAVELSLCSSTALWADTTLRGRLFGGRLGQMLFSLASSVSPTSASNSTSIASRPSASSVPPTSTFPSDSVPPIMSNNNNNNNTNNRSSSSNTMPPHKSSSSSAAISSSLSSLSLSDTHHHQHLTRALLHGAAGGDDSRWPQLLSALTGPILDSSPLVALRAAHVILSYSSAARLSCCCVPTSRPHEQQHQQQQSCVPFASQTFSLLVRATEASDARVAAACLRVLQAVVAAVGDARDAGAAHEVSDKVCRLVARQKMHVDAIFAWAGYSSSMIMSSPPPSAMASHLAHGVGVSGGGGGGVVGPPNGAVNNNANGQVQGNGGDGSSFDGVAAASSRPAAATGTAAVRNVFGVSNLHNSVGAGRGVGGGGYVPGQVMMNIDLNCDTHGHEFRKRAALRRRCLTKARTKRQQQQLKKQARKTYVTSAAQQNVNASNNENVNMNMNNNGADPMVVDSGGRKDDAKVQAKVWDENNVVDEDDEDEDDDDEADNVYLDEDDVDDGDVDDDMAQCNALLPLLYGGAGGGAVPGNGSGVAVHGADGATATTAVAAATTTAAVGGVESAGRTSASPALMSATPGAAATMMTSASSTSVQCEALQLIEAVTGLLMERDRNHHHQVRQQDEKRKHHPPPSSSSPSDSGPDSKAKSNGDNGEGDDNSDKDGNGDDSSADAMWAFVERGYDVVCDVLLHGARDDASIEAALGMLALAAMYAPYLITDYGGIDGVCAMLARLFWWLQHTEGQATGGGDVKSGSGCCWDRQTVVAMLKACVHVLVLVAPALNASRNKVDVNGPVRLTGLGVLAALAWPRQGLGATPAEFVVRDDDAMDDAGVDEGNGNGNADANDDDEQDAKKKIAGDDKADDDAGQKQQQQNKNKKKKSDKASDRNGGADVGGFGSQFVQDCQKAWTLLYRRTKNK